MVHCATFDRQKRGICFTSVRGGEVRVDDVIDKKSGKRPTNDGQVSVGPMSVLIRALCVIMTPVINTVAKLAISAGDSAHWSTRATIARPIRAHERGPPVTPALRVACSLRAA